MGKLAGFGHKWGLLGDADEDAGILPGPEWMKDRTTTWLIKTHNIDHWSQRANGQHLHRPGLRAGARRCRWRPSSAPWPTAAPSTSRGSTRTWSITRARRSRRDPGGAGLQHARREAVRPEGGAGRACARWSRRRGHRQRRPRFPATTWRGKTGTAQAYIEGRRRDAAGLEMLVLLLRPVRSAALRHLRGGRGRNLGRDGGGAHRLGNHEPALRHGRRRDGEPCACLEPLAGNFNGVTDIRIASRVGQRRRHRPTERPTADASTDTDDDNSTPVPDSPPAANRHSSSGTKHAR